METVEKLREDRDRLAIQAEKERLQYEIDDLRRSQRTEQVLEASRILADRAAFLYDHPGFGFPRSDCMPGSLQHVSQGTDRDRGQNRPFWETEIELSQIRGISRVLHGIDGSSIGIISTLMNYVLRTGYDYSAAAIDDSDSRSVAAAELSQAVIDEFETRVKWRRLQRELMERGIRDGEVINRIRHIGGGYADVKIVEPDILAEPADARLASDFLGMPLLDWSFGVGTDIGDTTRVHGYFLDRSEQSLGFDVVPSDEIVHIKRNVDTGIKRGVSDFYPVWRKLELAGKVEDNTGHGAAIQASIAYIREHQPGVTQAGVEAMNIGKREATLQYVTSDGNAINQNFVRTRSGRILDVPRGQKYIAGPMGSERNEGFIMVADQLRRHAGIRWSMPEYMTNGNAEQRSFAGLLVAESPFVIAVEAEQIWWKEEFLAILLKVLQIALNTQRFRQLQVSSLADLLSLVVIDVQCPQVSTRNRLESTKINSILNSHRLLSDRTWANREELDFDAEISQQAADGDDERHAARQPVNLLSDDSENVERQPINNAGTQES